MNPYVYIAMMMAKLLVGNAQAKKAAKIQQQNALRAYNSYIGQYQTMQEQVGQQYTQQQRQVMDAFNNNMASIGNQFASEGLGGNSENRVSQVGAQKVTRALDVIGMNQNNQSKQMYMEADAARQQAENMVLAATEQYRGQRNAMIAETAFKIAENYFGSPSKTAEMAGAAKQAGSAMATPDALTTLSQYNRSSVSASQLSIGNKTFDPNTIFQIGGN